MDAFSDIFERRKKLSIYWHNKASDLRASAGVLWAASHDQNEAVAAAKLGFPAGFSFSIACWPVYHMLCGMSLELLLKAVIVANGHKPRAIHDLVALCKDAGVSLTQKQSALLAILSEAIIWEGRYPVPKQEQQFRELHELEWKHLWDEVPTSAKIKIKRPNDNLGWTSFNKLWELVFDAYRPHF